VREFNIAGNCVPEMHYMVDISKKLEQIIKLIDGGKYFTINRARQYGKTTTMSQIYRNLNNRYLVIETSFEGLGDKAFENENEFCESFIKLITKRLKHNKVEKNIIDKWEENKSELEKFEELSDKITDLVESSDREIVLMIDEVDKSSNNQLFLHFIGMLRNKYLDRNKGYDKTFKSVILAGVYDVKNLKLKVRPDQERKYNSPWNIAVDFDVEMSFDKEEISTMLEDYEKENITSMDIQEISEELYNYTSGYPFLVSKLCKIIDEKLDDLKLKEAKWSKEGVKEAVKLILKERNTLFDDLIKNLENNEEMYNLIYRILIKGEKVDYSVDNPILFKGIMFGILKGEESKIRIHNKIFEIRIYNYMISKKQTSGEIQNYASESQFIKEDGTLYMQRILEKFQELMYHEYRKKDEKFIEREGRLLFLAFIKPIINGIGFYYVEAETRNSRRMDIVVTYNNKEYIIELKKWYRDKYEKKGHEQLADYLNSRNLEKGYMLVFDFREGKKYTDKWIEVKGKKIYEAIV